MSALSSPKQPNTQLVCFSSPTQPNTQYVCLVLTEATKHSTGLLVLTDATKHSKGLAFSYESNQTLNWSSFPHQHNQTLNWSAFPHRRNQTLNWSAFPPQSNQMLNWSAFSSPTQPNDQKGLPLSHESNQTLNRPDHLTLTQTQSSVNMLDDFLFTDTITIDMPDCFNHSHKHNQPPQTNSPSHNDNQTLKMLFHFYRKTQPTSQRARP